MTKFQDLVARIDKALSDRDAFVAQPQKAAQLAKQRGELAKALDPGGGGMADAVGGKGCGAMSTPRYRRAPTGLRNGKDGMMTERA